MDKHVKPLLMFLRPFSPVITSQRIRASHEIIQGLNFAWEILKYIVYSNSGTLAVYAHHLLLPVSVSNAKLCTAAVSPGSGD